MGGLLGLEKDVSEEGETQNLEGEGEFIARGGELAIGSQRGGWGMMSKSQLHT